MNEKRLAWIAAAIVFALFLMLVFGVTLAADLLTQRVAGELNVGHVLVLLIHVIPVACGIIYLRLVAKAAGT